jgi:hypothetical protein
VIDRMQLIIAYLWSKISQAWAATQRPGEDEEVLEDDR